MNRFLSTLLLAGALLIPGFASAESDSSLNYSDLREAIVAAKSVMADDNIELAGSERSHFNLIFETAYASTSLSPSSSNCFYGGWPSLLVNRKGHPVCENPKLHSNYLHEGCGGNELACNPAFFGPGLCVDISSSSLRQKTFSRCENRFQHARAGSYSYLSNLSQAEMLDLIGSLDSVGKVCSASGFAQKSSKMCKILVGKVKSIRSKLAAGKPKTKTNGKKDAGKQTPVVTAGDVNNPNQVNVLHPGPSALPVVSDVANRPQNNESCASCTANPPIMVSAGVNISRAISAIQDSTPESLYERIKNKYLASGKCHRYSYLPQSDQDEFMIKQFEKEWRTFSEQGTQLTQDQALNSITSAMSLPQAEKDELKTQMALLPPLVAGGQNLERAKFQATLMKKMKAHLGTEPLQTELDARVTQTLLKKGISEDCDFISKDAFVEAYKAKQALGSRLAKPNILSIVDRSIPKSSRRFMTVDLAGEEVLFHSSAGFGDGDGNVATVGPESDYCSNQSNHNDSPYGIAVTGITRRANDQNNGFPGLGTMLQTQAPNYPAGGFRDRGIAVHTGGGGIFSGYTPDENHDKRPGENLDAVLNGDNSREAVNAVMWTGSIRDQYTGSTNGCIGLPEDQLQAIQHTIQGGSAVYFYCTSGMKR